jgi:hypothetical protein
LHKLSTALQLFSRPNFLHLSATLPTSTSAPLDCFLFSRPILTLYSLSPLDLLSSTSAGLPILTSRFSP